MQLFKRANGRSKVRAEIGQHVTATLSGNSAVTAVPIPGLQAFYCDDFLDEARCKLLMDIIDTNKRPSTLLSDREDYGFRTSESCDMDRWSREVRPVDEGIAVLLGLDPKKGETMQGQRYAPGQYFRAHHDFFYEDQQYWQKVKLEGGQRTWTAMIYLNNVDEGGATWFPKAGIKVAPKRGLLLIWNNMTPDGTPNEMTLHEAMPVMRGKKYVVTKWFREGNWIR